MTKLPAFNNKALAFSRSQLATGIATATIAILSGNAYAQEEKRGYSLILEEVLVTAQKREKNYLSVPIKRI